MKTLSEMEEILRQNKPELEKRFKVKEIGIFGSFVRGDQKEKSDLDVLVEFEEPVSLLKLVSVENFLSETLGIKVDVIPKKDLRLELKQRILREVAYI
ncbi:MAG: nucleotidyltransferase family protein [Candidatus Latescibacteria bacterium]|nr:nucleotidyltransferase family protein [Candidatus Latescibacterota bacterium]